MRELLKFGIYHNNVKRALFDNFLTQPGHEHYLQDFLICCTHSQKHRLLKIINAFEFTLLGGITYAQLFKLHSDWHAFFAENAWISGIPRSGDDRFGSDAATAHDVMRTYNIGGMDLDQAIAIAFDNKFRAVNSTS